MRGKEEGMKKTVGSAECDRLEERSDEDVGWFGMEEVRSAFSDLEGEKRREDEVVRSVDAGEDEE